MRDEFEVYFTRLCAYLVKSVRKIWWIMPQSKTLLNLVCSSSTKQISSLNIKGNNNNPYCPFLINRCVFSLLKLINFRLIAINSFVFCLFVCCKENVVEVFAFERGTLRILLCTWSTGKVSRSSTSCCSISHIIATPSHHSNHPFTIQNINLLLSIL